MSLSFLADTSRSDATKRWIIPLEVKLFAHLTLKNERNNQQWKKRTGYSPKRIHVIFLTKLCWSRPILLHLGKFDSQLKQSIETKLN